MRFASKSSLAAATIALVLPAALPSHAATIHVPDEEPTIQAGINAAVLGDTVLVACGMYFEHDIVMKSGVRLESETGEPDCATIDALHGGRVFSCDGNDDVDIRGFTVRNGFSGYEQGGGLLCVNSTVALSRMIFLENVAYRDGGAVYSHGSVLSCRDVTFSHNDALAGFSGGGIFCASSPCSLVNVTFDGNEATNVGGGAYFSGTAAVLKNVEFLTNWADDGGGGMYCSVPALLESVEFTNNTVAGYAGGGMFCYGCSPTLTDVVFSGNSVIDGDGGGMYCDGTCSPTLERVDFTGNTCAYSGGGMRIGDGSAVLTDVTFTENAANNGGGGGMYASGGNSSPILTSVTFAGNTADDGYGGGFCCYAGSPSLSDVSFERNSGTFGGAIACFGYGASPVFAGITTFRNRAWEYGGSIYCGEYAIPTFELVTSACDSAGISGGGVCCDNASPGFDRVIVAYSLGGGGVYGLGSSFPSFECSDVYGNVGGEYGGSVDDQTGVFGNISADPLFCEAAIGNLMLHADSPCAEENSPACGAIGALGVGCPATGVADTEIETSWGGIKAMYR